MSKQKLIEGCRYIVFKKGREKIYKLIYDGFVEKDDQLTHRFIESFANDEETQEIVLEISASKLSEYIVERIVRP